MMPFDRLGLSPPVLQALADLRYRETTPVQEACIPVMLAGRDLLVQAPTGTGKTAAFAVPLVERAKPGLLGALVLVPTRELTAQVAEEVAAVGRHAGVRSLAAYGGVSINPQADALRAGEVEVLVATPGRLLDLLKSDAVPTKAISTVVLDEADRMLDMGFIEDVDRILARLPAKRQTVLASATLPPEVVALARRTLREPERVLIGSGQASPTALAEQRYMVVDEWRKVDAVKAYLDAEDPFDILLFVNTRDRADEVARALRALKVEAAPFHGGIPQGKRERTLDAFRVGEKVRVLVATDVAARGLDVRGIACVVNYDVPENREDYIHRVGRTGRAGRRGVALTLLTPKERGMIVELERVSGGSLVRQRLPGFE